MKSPCHNHGYPVKHNLEDCDLIKCYLKGEYKVTGADKPAGSTGDEEKGDTFLDPKRYLMIFGGPAASESKCRQKLMAREVNAATNLGEAIPAFMKWSETTITFDRMDHPDYIPQLRRFPLIINTIIGKMRLS